jgi:hypothetical protein
MIDCGKKVNGRSANDTPKCLLKIVEFLNSYKLNVNKEHSDGRVGSIADEDSCINALKQCEDFNVVDESIFNEDECGDKLCVVVPKAREWYDIKVVYDKKTYYINIKSSTLKTKDNVGCINEVMYGLFGKMIESSKNRSKTEKYESLYDEYNKCLENGFDDVEDYDYYFLIIDKMNNGECFITSLSHVNKDSIAPNGSNPPFQCRWDINSNEKSSKEEICKLVMETITSSLLKPLEIFRTNALITYMNIHNKSISL